MQNTPLDTLIKMLGGLPGLGNRSARRIALHLLTNRAQIMTPLANAIQNAAENIRECNQCHNLDMQSPCGICQDMKRNAIQICVVAGVSDLWAIERTGTFKGQYHVLGGMLSALDGIGPDQLNIASLIERIHQTEPEEIILALSATVDGQSTAHIIADRLSGMNIKITHLAHGMPVGGELDYMDDGTITTALNARK
ncbi:MAG: recombination mediator RecR [Alphaproteobacteria bacterium]